MIKIINNILFYKLLLLLLLKTVFCDETVEVKLKQGVLLGKTDKTLLKQQNYYAFKGVPYAEPPVGKLRFMPSKVHLGWEEPYEAFKNKPTCIQYNGRMRNNEPFGISGSEDCLYISIFTPNLQGSAPVVVFDYNDNFKLGFNGSDTYSPEFFVEEDVIVVTISHRLGLFGYLTTEDEVIPPNAGLKDFILGLNWVKDNIEHFGGDSERVTLMGNRGGAALANILLYSEKAKGLFSAVMLQSGTALETIYFYDKPSRKTYEFAQLFNIELDDRMLLQELQKIDAEALVEKEVYVIDSEGLKQYQMSIHPFGPTIERDHNDAVLTFLPEKGKMVNDVPVLIGLNSREGLDLVSMFIFEPRILKDVTERTSFHFPIRTNYRFDRDSSVFAEALSEINDFYLEDGYLHFNNILEYAVCTGDELQNYAIDYAAKKMAKELNSPVFYYMFDFRGSLNENSEYLMRYSRFPLENWGATITDELCYLHVCSRIRKNYKNMIKLVTEQAEMKVLKKMVRMWTNFAKTRNPTPEKDAILQDLVWQPMDKTSGDAKYLHISKIIRMKRNPLGERPEFWDKLLARYAKMAVNGVVTDDPSRDEL